MKLKNFDHLVWNEAHKMYVYKADKTIPIDVPVLIIAFVIFSLLVLLGI
jgi:hypothetical protein